MVVLVPHNFAGQPSGGKKNAPSEMATYCAGHLPRRDPTRIDRTLAGPEMAKAETAKPKRIPIKLE